MFNLDEPFLVVYAFRASQNHSHGDGLQSQPMLLEGFSITITTIACLPFGTMQAVVSSSSSGPSILHLIPPYSSLDYLPIDYERCVYLLRYVPLERTLHDSGIFRDRGYVALIGNEQ